MTLSYLHICQRFGNQLNKILVMNIISITSTVTKSVIMPTCSKGIDWLDLATSAMRKLCQANYSLHRLRMTVTVIGPSTGLGVIGEVKKRFHFSACSTV